ncbi:hypothetical protein GQX74_015595 [Glossina fuscipes]|nr:hypothetical protein GQX74_015595 [Glossina fuscipes]
MHEMRLLYLRLRPRYSSSLPLWPAGTRGLIRCLLLSRAEVLLVAQQPIGATLEPVDVEVIRCNLAVSLDGAAVATIAPLAVPLRNGKICSDSIGGASISIGIAPELVVIIGYGCVEADELAIVTICNVCGGESVVSVQGGDVWGGIDDLRLFTKR